MKNNIQIRSHNTKLNVYVKRTLHFGMYCIRKPLRTRNSRKKNTHTHREIYTANITIQLHQTHRRLVDGGACVVCVCMISEEEGNQK